MSELFRIRYIPMRMVDVDDAKTIVTPVAVAKVSAAAAVAAVERSN